MFRRLRRLYGNATQTIANDPDRFKLYTIVPIVRIELNSIQAIEVVSVVRVVCDRLGSVSIWSSRSSEHFFETTGTIRTIIWKPGFTLNSFKFIVSWQAWLSRLQVLPLYQATRFANTAANRIVSPLGDWVRYANRFLLKRKSPESQVP